MLSRIAAPPFSSSTWAEGLGFFKRAAGVLRGFGNSGPQECVSLICMYVHIHIHTKATTLARQSLSAQDL